MMKIVLWLLLICRLTVIVCEGVLEVKIGFLSASSGKKLGAKNAHQSYSKPAQHLSYAFQYGIDRINQQYANRSNGGLLFSPIILETAGNESESIKQTIELILRHRVNVIVGPQETCQVESRLASVFNVAMVSYYCPQGALPLSLINRQPSGQQLEQGGEQGQVTGGGRPTQTTSPAATFIQTKPPNWKIVDRVVSLVAQLLAANNNRAQQLILLYFKEPTMTTTATSGRFKSSSIGAADSLVRDANLLANDAAQYKLIGELLEIELNELLKTTAATARRGAGGKLAVLNWNTTFHYGYTKNPFLRIIRRHHQRQASAYKQQQQCGGNGPPTSQRMAGDNDRSVDAIYIVVGHYYEHLGLMLALEELNLLDGRRHGRTLAPQSSVPGRPGHSNNKAMVVGVDTEQYDERNDSERFLRGLLMESVSAAPADPTHMMYRHYMGVVPARPTQKAEFLMNMRSLYLQSGRQERKQEEPNADHQSLHSIDGDDDATPPSATASVRLTTTQLMQLMRLPVEAFYLFDALTLVGDYFDQCLGRNTSSLEACSRGHQVFSWFANRPYLSSVDNNLTFFDSMGQSEGSYLLIGHRLELNDSTDSSSPGNDDDVGFGMIAPIGLFTNGESFKNPSIELFADWQEIDPVWLPLWCRVKQSNESQCINATTGSTGDEFNAENELDGDTKLIIAGLSLLVLLTLLLSIRLLVMNMYPQQRGCSLITGQSTPNEGWFDEADEKNFLTIVHKYLVSSEITSTEVDSNNEKQMAAIGLHCRMFPFPSCKFVHWLTAMHQLKEMMFQYQCQANLKKPADTSSSSSSSSSCLVLILRGNFFDLKRITKKGAQKGAKEGARGFFLERHKGTNSLRLLLNKYKSINECFCRLARLDHELVARLHGLSLTCNPARGGGGIDGGKAASLLVEQTGRGNLRQALGQLDANLDAREAASFKQLVALHIIDGLLEGLGYLHRAEGIQFHGELRATTCLITTNWRLKLSGFHAHHMRRSLGDYEQKQAPIMSNASGDSGAGGAAAAADDDMMLLYQAPEVLENHNRPGGLSVATLRLADIYSFAFIVYELLVGQEPWSCLTPVTSAKLLLERVKVDSSFRPPLARLDNKAGARRAYSRQEDLDGADTCSRVSSSFSVSSAAAGATAAAATTADATAVPPPPPSNLVTGPSKVTTGEASINSPSRCLHLDAAQRTIGACWSQAPSKRPQSIEQLKRRLVRVESGKGARIGGGDDDVMRVYARLLESAASRRGRQLRLEQKRALVLKLRLLPEPVVAKLNDGGEREVSRQFDCVSLLAFRFLPLLPENSAPTSVFELLNEILVQLDGLLEKYHHQIHLVDSQVDSSLRYLVYAGEPLATMEAENGTGSGGAGWSHHQLVASFALQLIDLANRCQSQKGACVQVRCGLHCGPVVAGLVAGPHPTTRGGGNGGVGGEDDEEAPHKSLSPMSRLARYVLFGSTISLADLLETSGLAQHIQISNEFRQQLQQQQRRLEQANHELWTATSRQVALGGGGGGGACSQGYVVIKRQAKISSRQFGELEAFWLLNGPRLTTGQSLMLSR